MINNNKKKVKKICSIPYNFRRDHAKAVDILVKDLKVFASYDADLFKEITHLLTLDNFRYLLLRTMVYSSY